MEVEGVGRDDHIEGDALSQARGTFASLGFTEYADNFGVKVARFVNFEVKTDKFVKFPSNFWYKFVNFGANRVRGMPESGSRGGRTR